jgi:hypothetical protein
VALTASGFGSQRHCRVRYIYGQTAKLGVIDLPATLHPEDLAALPDEFGKAVFCLDPAVSERNATLGSIFGRLAVKLAYSPILSALSKSSSTEEAVYDDPDR